MNEVLGINAIPFRLPRTSARDQPYNRLPKSIQRLFSTYWKECWQLSKAQVALFSENANLKRYQAVFPISTRLRLSDVPLFRVYVHCFFEHDTEGSKISRIVFVIYHSEGILRGRGVVPSTAELLRHLAPLAITIAFPQLGVPPGLARAIYYRNNPSTPMFDYVEHQISR